MVVSDRQENLVLDMKLFNILLERDGIDATYDEALALALKELKEEKELLNTSTLGCSS